MAVATSTMAMIAVAGLGVGSAITQGMAGHQQAKSIKKQGEYNALVYEQQASMIKEQKKIEEYQFNRAGAKMRGKIAAKAGGAGLLLSGSPLALLVDSETQLQFDKAVGQYNLDVQRNYSLSGADYYRKNAKEQARLAKTQGYSNAFSTLLNTGASLGMMNMSANAATKAGKI